MKQWPFSCNFCKKFIKLLLLIAAIKSSDNETQKQPPKVFCKKGVFENFAKFKGKQLNRSLFSLFNKVAGLRPLTQVFSCEFCEIPKNTFFTEHLWTTASRNSKYEWSVPKGFIGMRFHFKFCICFNTANIFCRVTKIYCVKRVESNILLCNDVL